MEATFRNDGGGRLHVFAQQPEPEEIASVILFLASERASWVCGEVVNVDGGKLHRDNWF